MYPSELADVIPQKAPNDNLAMDKVLIVPQVESADYCEDAPAMEIITADMYVPGICIGSITEGSCIQGELNNPEIIYINPVGPRPIYFNKEKAMKRMKSAIKKANVDYQKDYQKDIIEAVKPTAKFFPMMWNTPLTGAIVAPTTTLKPDPQAMMDVVKEAQDNVSREFGKPFKVSTQPYFAQGIIGNAATQPLRVHLLPQRKDVMEVGNPSGVWQLEEYKRRFPIEPAPIYERYGYTNLFQVWSRPGLKLLPEKPSHKLLRQVVYHGAGYLFTPYPVPIPSPVALPEFTAGLPYTGVQTHFAWTSVPESYPVPRVSGMPPVDYKGVIK